MSPRSRTRSQRLTWRALGAVGFDEARWRRQPEIVQRAVPPLVIAVFVLLVAWLLGLPPHPTLVVLLAIYVRALPAAAAHPAVRRPVTVLVLAVVYPIAWANEQAGQNWLFEVPVFKALPTMDTMVAIVPLRDDGDRAEHGRRLRRAARPRLRRVLRHRRLHGRLARVAALRGSTAGTSRSAPSGCRPGSAASTSRSGSCC